MKLKQFTQIICFAFLLAGLPEITRQLGGRFISSASAAVLLNDISAVEPLYISGTAMQESGVPAAGAFIELDCRGSVTREATVGSDGNFSFRLGEGVRSNQQDQDLSQYTTDPFGRNTRMIPFDVGTISTNTAIGPRTTSYSSRLTGCVLQASLRGYKSSKIELGTDHLSMLSHVGTLILYRLEKVRGATVSSTSLRAPKSSKKAMEKAEAALRKNNAVESEKYLKEAIARYPQYGEAWFQLGRLYQKQQRFKEARDAYTKSIECDNLYVNPHVWLGVISAAEQKWQEAADLTERAISLDPTTYPEAYYVNALSAFYLNNRTLAERSALRAELLDSTHRFSKVHLILANIFADRNDLVGSIGELRKYIQYGPRGKSAIQEQETVRFLEPDWDAASESQKQDIASSSETEIRLKLAEALLGAGMVNPAKAELIASLKGGSSATLPPWARDLLKDIEDPKKNEPAPAAAKSEKAEAKQVGPIDYVGDYLQNLPDFEPARDQSSMESILAAAGDNVSKLFANLFNLSAIENVQMERVDRKGNADRSKKYEYLYLCLGAIEKQEPYFDEYRSDEKGNELRQLGLEEGYMLTSGFMSAPIIFHPIHQNGISYQLLGYQKLRGRNTFVISYVQIPARCRLKGYFQAGKNVQEIFKQGLAWIDMKDYQIIRLVSDLLQPLPQVGLEKLRTEIDFDEVQFAQAEQKFMLPVQVMVTVNCDGKFLRNIHQYSDFKKFGVQTSQKIDKPKDSGKMSK